MSSRRSQRQTRGNAAPEEAVSTTPKPSRGGDALTTSSSRRSNRSKNVVSYAGMANYPPRESTVPSSEFRIAHPCVLIGAVDKDSESWDEEPSDDDETLSKKSSAKGYGCRLVVVMAVNLRPMRIGYPAGNDGWRQTAAAKPHGRPRYAQRAHGATARERQKAYARCCWAGEEEAGSQGELVVV
jgi:hypothetical protein